MNSESLQTSFPEPPGQHRSRAGLGKFWDQLTKPHATITEVGQRRQAALMAALAIIFGLFCAIGYFAISASHQSFVYPGALMVGGLAVVCLVTYILARSRFFRAGAFLAVAATFATGYGLILFGVSRPVDAFFSTMPLAIILSVGLLTINGQMILFAINLAVSLTLSLTLPQMRAEISAIVGIFVATGLLAIIITATRDSIERARLKEIRLANQQLSELSASLEQRVTERTKDVALAAEIGRRVSRVQDPNILLSDAVELIRERFDLYYVQIYLVNPETKNLVLRAGTGEVGRELLERAHRLPLDLTSINGTAAIERRAVIVTDTSNSRIFRPNRLLPETHSEMSVPLISGEQVLGVLNLQSKVAGSLSEENMAAFEVLASQLASSLHSASVFSETTTTLKELEARTQNAVKTGWEDYLDAIEQRERIAYVAEADKVQPVADIPAELEAGKRTLVTPIAVAGETIGEFKFAGEQPWTNQDQTLAATVADQVAQRLENLRLLTQADRYRKEAEDTLRQVTGQSWRDYLKSLDQAQVGYTYDHEMVTTGIPEVDLEKEALNFDLKVQETPIGLLQIVGKDWLSVEDSDLVKSVSEQLSAHLENMRLFNAAQRELEERRLTETRLSEAQQAAKLASWTLDVATTTFIFNDEFYRLVGTSIEQEGTYEMPAHIYAQRFVHPEDAHILGALASDDPNFEYEGTSRLIRTDGEIIYVTVRTRVQMDNKGHVIRLNGANQDVTEQVLQQELLASERLRLAEALDVAKMAYWMYDFHTSTFILNDDIFRLFGTSLEEEGSYEMPVSTMLLKFIHPADREKLVAALQESAQDPEASGQRELTYRVIRGTGEGMTILSRYRIDRDAQGVIRVVGTNQDVTEQVRQQELTAQRAAELAMVAEVSTTISTLLDPDKMLQQVVDLTKERFNLYHAHIYLLDETNQNLILRAGAGEVGRTMVSEGRSIPIDSEKSLVARTARNRKGEIVNDTYIDPYFLPHPLLPNTASEASVPLVVGDQLLGVLDVQDDQVGRFTEESVNVLTTLASQVAVSLQNSRSYTRAQQQAERESLINAISERIQSTTSVESALQVAVRELGRALGAQRTVIQLGLQQQDGKDN